MKKMNTSKDTNELNGILCYSTQYLNRFVDSTNYGTSFVWLFERCSSDGLLNTCQHFSSSSSSQFSLSKCENVKQRRRRQNGGIRRRRALSISLYLLLSWKLIQFGVSRETVGETKNKSLTNRWRPDDLEAKLFVSCWSLDSCNTLMTEMISSTTWGSNTCLWLF